MDNTPRNSFLPDPDPDEDPPDAGDNNEDTNLQQLASDDIPQGPDDPQPTYIPQGPDALQAPDTLQVPNIPQVTDPPQIPDTNPDPTEIPNQVMNIGQNMYQPIRDLGAFETEQALEGTAGGRELQGTESGRELQGAAGGREPQGAAGGREPQGAAGGRKLQGATGGREHQGADGAEEPEGATGGTNLERDVSGEDIDEAGTGDGESAESGRTRRGRGRTQFPPRVSAALESRFIRQSYLSKEERIELADKLGLEEQQVMVWFQNRRGRLKKKKEKDPAYTPQKFAELENPGPYPHLRGYLPQLQHFPGMAQQTAEINPEDFENAIADIMARNQQYINPPPQTPPTHPPPHPPLHPHPSRHPHPPLPDPARGTPASSLVPPNVNPFDPNRIWPQAGLDHYTGNPKPQIPPSLPQPPQPLMNPYNQQQTYYPDGRPGDTQGSETHQGSAQPNPYFQWPPSDGANAHGGTTPRPVRDTKPASAGVPDEYSQFDPPHGLNRNTGTTLGQATQNRFYRFSMEPFPGPACRESGNGTGRGTPPPWQDPCVQTGAPALGQQGQDHHDAHGQNDTSRPTGENPADSTGGPWHRDHTQRNNPKLRRQNATCTAGQNPQCADTSGITEYSVNTGSDGTKPRQRSQPSPNPTDISADAQQNDTDWNGARPRQRSQPAPNPADMTTDAQQNNTDWNGARPRQRSQPAPNPADISADTDMTTDAQHIDSTGWNGTRLRQHNDPPQNPRDTGVGQIDNTQWNGAQSRRRAIGQTGAEQSDDTHTHGKRPRLGSDMSAAQGNQRGLKGQGSRPNQEEDKQEGNAVQASPNTSRPALNSPGNNFSQVLDSGIDTPSTTPTSDRTTPLSQASVNDVCTMDSYDFLECTGIDYSPLQLPPPEQNSQQQCLQKMEENKLLQQEQEQQLQQPPQQIQQLRQLQQQQPQQQQRQQLHQLQQHQRQQQQMQQQGQLQQTQQQERQQLNELQQSQQQHRQLQHPQQQHRQLQQSQQQQGQQLQQSQLQQGQQLQQSQLQQGQQLQQSQLQQGQQLQQSQLQQGQQLQQSQLQQGQQLQQSQQQQGQQLQESHQQQGQLQHPQQQQRQQLQQSQLQQRQQLQQSQQQQRQQLQHPQQQQRQQLQQSQQQQRQQLQQPHHLNQQQPTQLAYQATFMIQRQSSEERSDILASNMLARMQEHSKPN